jgi:hypothetical protein
MTHAWALIVLGAVAYVGLASSVGAILGDVSRGYESEMQCKNESRTDRTGRR